MNRTEIGVYAGEETPLIRPYVDAMDTHGRDGLGESGLADSTVGQAKGDAVRFLADILLSQDDVSVIALGPLTNLARLRQEYPDALLRIIILCPWWYIQSPRKLFPCSRIHKLLVRS